MSYVWEKFNLAMRTLNGSGAPKDRLIGAFDTIMLLRPEEVPEERQKDFDRFIQEMTRIAPEGDEGPVHATVSSMDDDEVDRMIERIVSLHDTIERHRQLV